MAKKRNLRTTIPIDDPDKWNEIVTYARDTSVLVYRHTNTREPWESMNFHSILFDGQRYAYLTTSHWPNSKGKAVTFVFDKTGQEQIKKPTGQQVFMEMQREYKVRDFRTDDSEEAQILQAAAELENNKFVASVGPIHGVKEGASGKEFDKVYFYDITSAYGYRLTQPLPDTTKLRVNDFVKENEIGFAISTNKDLTKTVSLRHTGCFAPFVCPLMDSPYKDYALRWFQRKQNALTKQDKVTAKVMLNYGIGYWQLVNPLMRWYIVLTCNEYIQSLIDEDTVMWNTDAIYSTRERTDLPLGDGLGQFHQEHEPARLRIKGFDYQIGDELPHASGTVREFFKGKFNLLRDEKPRAYEGEIYKVHFLTGRIYRNGK